MTAAVLSDAGKRSRWHFESGSEGKISPGEQDELSAGSLQPDW